MGRKASGGFIPAGSELASGGLIPVGSELASGGLIPAGKIMRGLFFTGTDTGVGKTFVVSSIARWLISQNHPVQVCKPLATGAVWDTDHWVSEDTLQLANAVGLKPDAEVVRKISPWTFEPPVAPSVAARLANVALSVEKIAATIRRLYHPENLMLIEGVGGLLCPITETETVADLARDLGLPTVVITRRSLGTLNHTLMTLEIAESRGLNVVGIVISETTPPEGIAEETNVEELRKRIHVPLLGVIPWQVSGNENDALSTIENIDWQSLGE